MKKIELEFELNTSVKVLFTRLSTTTGLSEWYADNVSVQDDIFTFEWEGVVEEARLVAMKDLSSVRFHWLESEDDDSYFEFRIVESDLSNDIALVVTDFVIDDEEDETIELWNTQIANLKRVLGA
ncbi:MAG: SRPBCC domain-containing protein [Bacteroidales bacterium]|nr:SRPBCC domain-containing protein [Bacteroidales bacterium]